MVTPDSCHNASTATAATLAARLALAARGNRDVHGPSLPACTGEDPEKGISMRTHLLATAIAASAFLCSSCGQSNGLYPVYGKVLYKGEPAVGATVTFVPKGQRDVLHEQTPQGVVEEDGSFTLAGPLGQGAVPGEYVVLVEWKEGAGKKRGRAPALTAPDLLKKKYLNPAKPLLTSTVEPKSNVLAPFEVH
jgi:hypothetical protein